MNSASGLRSLRRHSQRKADRPRTGRGFRRRSAEWWRPPWQMFVNGNPTCMMLGTSSEERFSSGQPDAVLDLGVIQDGRRMQRGLPCKDG